MNWLAEKAWDIIAGVFSGLWTSISAPFESLHGLKTLVYNTGDKVYGVFDPDQINNTIAPGIQSMSYIVGFFLMLGIIFMGVKISNTGLNPANRTVFLEFIRDWVMIVVALANIGFIYEMIFMFNSAIVGIVHGEVIDALDDKLTPDIDDSGLVGWILIGLFMLGITIWANFYYIMREITLSVLMVLGPIFLALYIFPSTKGVTVAWLKEFFGTVMVQSVHAVTLFTVASIGNSGETGAIELTIMYLVIIPTGEAIRGLLNLGGDMTGKLGRAASMSGMAGIAGVYGAVKSATSGKGYVESLRNGVEGSRGAGGGKEGEDGSGATVGPVAGTDTRSSRMLKAGDIVSKAGKMAVGASGAIAGAVMGPQGAMIGGGVGAELGGMAGGAAGRYGYAARDKIKNGLAKTGDGLHRGVETAKQAAEAKKAEAEADFQADNLAGIQTEQWAKDNKDDFMKANGEHPNAEQLWNKRLASKRNKFKHDNKAALLNGTMDSNFAKASDLAEQVAQERLNNDLQKNGRDKFVSQLQDVDKMSQEDIDKAWKTEKASRLQKYRQEANGLAKKMVGNKPLDSSIDKNAFLENYKDNEMAKVDKAEGRFKDKFKKENPNASEQDVNNAWGEERNTQLQKITSSADRISKNASAMSPISMNPNDRKASDLATSAADAMTKDWADANEKTFKEKIKTTGTQKIEQEVEKDWNQQVSQVQKDNRNQAKVETQNWANQNEQDVKASLLRDNPNLTPQQLDNTFSTLVDGKMNENMKKADANSQNWAAQNQQPVKSAMRQEKLQGLENKVNDSWKNAVEQQLNSNYNLANGVAQEVSGGQSLSAYVNKEQFGQALAGKRIESAKNNFAKQNPQLQGDALDKAWGQQNAEKVITASSMGAAMSVPKREISKGYGTKTALASQFATQATDSWANNPQNRQAFEQKYTNDFNKAPENASLKQSNPSAYKEKLNNAMGEKWNEAVNGKFNENMKAAEGSMLMDNSSNGVVIPHSVASASVISGAKGFGKGFVEGSGFGRERKVYKDAYKNATGNRAEKRNAAIREVYNDRLGPEASTEEKAKAYRDDVTYNAGVALGVNGYQRKAQKVMDMNKSPFANQMYQSAHEVSDIARMAKTETIDLPNGQQQTRIAQGAVQLVVEKDRSYIQVETKDGQFNTVSQYGAGDSTLEEGTVLFKDYNIENQELTPSSSSRNPNSNGFYAKDTAGHKVSLNRKVNIDANSLLQSRRNIPNQELEPRHSAYNVKVDQGQFDANDIKTHSADKKATLVVEQNRSYVAMTGEDNKMYRVSPVSEVGNSNLKNGEVIYKEYAVEGGQLRERSLNDEVQLKTYTRDPQGKQRAIDSNNIPDSIQVNEMVEPPKNRRFKKRQQLERNRTKSGAYL